jgi:putative membrane protein
MRAMVSDHVKDIAAFKMEAKSGKDAEIKAWAAKTLPTLEEHLRMARQASGGVGTSGKK